MRLVRKILGFGLLAAGVVYLRGRRTALRVARGAEAKFDDNFGTSAPTNDDLIAVATESGIADVDPEPITQIAGEGIDPISDPEAHNSIRDLRDRLPR